MNNHWQFQPILDSFWLVAALCAGLLGMLWLRPGFASLSTGRQRWLFGLRLAVILLLALLMLRPARVTTRQLVEKSVLLLLYDVSRSMELPAGDGRSRWNVQQDVLRQAETQLGGLLSGYDVDLLGFGEQIHEPYNNTDSKNTESNKTGSKNTAPRWQTRPTDNATDLGLAIEQALLRHTGRRIAAVVLISDGAQRSLAGNVSPQQAARQLDRRSAPLYTLAIGRSLAATESRDVAIENFRDEYSVFVKNELSLRVGVRVQGYSRQPIPVYLDITDAAGRVRSLSPITVTAQQDSQVVMAEFQLQPDVAGAYRLRVRAESQATETNLSNNEMTAFLEVREGGLRVLLLTAALLGEEQKFIRRALDESTEIELDWRAVQLANQNDWPIDLQADLELDDYDVFLVGDLDATAFRPDNWQRIANLVAEGRGFLMYGGRHSFGAGGYFADGGSRIQGPAESIGQLLPVETRAIERQSLDPREPLRRDAHLSGPLVMIPAVSSPITRLAGQDENERRWRNLPPLDGANVLRPRDRTEVLATTASSDSPLLVQGNFELGRVLALGTNSTHKWWRYGFQEEHKRFWRQSILWLARRDQRQASEIWIDLPQRRFLADGRVSYTTGLADEAGDPVTDPALKAVLVGPDQTETELPLTSDNETMKGVISQAEKPGIYRLRVESLDARVKPKEVEFVVISPDLELSEPAANPGLLDLMAKETQRLGGRAIASEELPALLNQLKANPPGDIVETDTKWQLADTTWDAWLVFLILVGLLGSEWFLRKRWGLV